MTFFPLGNADAAELIWNAARRYCLISRILVTLKTRMTSGATFLMRFVKTLKTVIVTILMSWRSVILILIILRARQIFFTLEYAKKYQSDERIKMQVMWVPAALITEQSPDDDEARILQEEARYRFREGKGIRVFSRPERLRKWCEKNDIELDDRLDIISDAGTVAPEFSLDKDKVEFFVHSPFAVRQDENTVEDRNEDSLVLHTTFEIDGVQTKALFLADSTHEVLSQIVDITKAKENHCRLEWDIAKLPHHCSYLSIGPEKGEDKTEAVEQVDWLYGEQGQDGAIAVSTSKPIPTAGSDEDEDPQPPHRQAANYYKEITGNLGGQFVVTMEHPTAKAPKPFVIEIGGNKATLKKATATAVITATSRRAPRAG